MSTGNDNPAIEAALKLIRKDGRCLKIMSRLQRDEMFRGYVAAFLVFEIDDFPDL